MKALGIDFGEVRIGIAATDDLGMMAHPVETITIDIENEQTPDDAIPRIIELATQRDVEVLVIGHPIHMNGSPSISSEKVEAWVEKISEEIPEIHIELLDERLTTVEAEAKLREAGKTAKEIKVIIDQAAAVVILQDYLDNQAGAAEEFDDNLDSPRGKRDLDLAAFADDDDDGGFGFGNDDEDDDDEDEFATSWGDADTF